MHDDAGFGTADRGRASGGEPSAQPVHESAGAAARAEAGRLRAAETKRARSRDNLVAAAAQLFAGSGWYRTRVEDIAAAAKVSVATTYNHFDSKYDLLAAAYAPLLHPVIARAERDVAATVPTMDALDRCLHDLARLARTHAAMTLALLSALPEIYDREGMPVRTADPRHQVEYERPITTILAAGRARGDIAPTLADRDIGVVLTGTLLVRVMNTPKESARATGDLLFRMVSGGLLT